MFVIHDLLMIAFLPLATPNNAIASRNIFFFISVVFPTLCQLFWPTPSLPIIVGEAAQAPSLPSLARDDSSFFLPKGTSSGPIISYYAVL